MNKRIANRRTAIAGLVGYLAPWVVLAPAMARNSNLWLVFVLGLSLVFALAVLALRGKFDDPASPYVRALKIAAIGALAAGALFLAYTYLAGG